MGKRKPKPRPLCIGGAAAALAVAALALGLAIPAPPLLAAREAPKVVASIKPLHALVAGVMAGVAEPLLLVTGAGSPHTGGLRPSAARALNDADLVFWIGGALEAFLAKPMQSLARKARIVTLTGAEGIEILEARAGGAWVTEQGGGERAKVTEGTRTDPHFWLDPENAKAMVAVTVAALGRADPAHARRYAANAQRLTRRLEALDQELKAILAPVRDRPYVVFHDAYQYFERHYATKAVGSITVSPERSPGAKRLAEMRQRIEAAGALCVFAEPQFEPALVRTLTVRSGVRAAVLDPLGSEVAPGPEAYFTLMRSLAEALANCLK